MSGRRAVKFYQADVFTSTVFGGNPVAVVPEAAGLTDGEMQKIAREMNLSETVFVLPVSAPGADVRLRFFTPLQEIVFAGHPVLGAFYILAHIGVISLIEPVTRLHQETHVGVFPVELFVHDDLAQFSPFRRGKGSPNRPSLPGRGSGLRGAVSLFLR